MTKRLTDKQKSDRAYIRKFRKADPTGLGPYNIIWGSKDPHGVSHVKMEPGTREIHIQEADTKDTLPFKGTVSEFWENPDQSYYGHSAAAVLAHEIAHSRTVKSKDMSEWEAWEESGTSQITRDPHGEWVSVQYRDSGEKPYYSKIFVWREIEAALYQLAKGWELERWHLLTQLHDASTYFGDGTLKWAKIIGRKILEHQVQAGHITKEQSRKAIQEVNAIKGSEWKDYEGSFQHYPLKGRHHRSYFTAVSTGPFRYEEGIDDNN